MKTSARIETLEMLGRGGLVTANMLGKLTGYTPQHIRRVLKELFKDGRVAYAEVQHRKGQLKRKWCLIESADRYEDKYQMEFPEFIQERLPL